MRACPYACTSQVVVRAAALLHPALLSEFLCRVLCANVMEEMAIHPYANYVLQVQNHA